MCGMRFFYLAAILFLFFLSQDLNHVHSVPISPSNNTVRGSGSAVISQFIGLLGQIYEVRGVDGYIYNLLSDADTQMNARYTYLKEGECPTPYSPSKNYTAEEKKEISSIACWSAPGTYLSALSIQNSLGDRLFLQAGSAHLSFKYIAVDSPDLDSLELNQVGQVWKSNNEEESANSSSNMTVIYSSFYTVNVIIGIYSFTIQNSDNFLTLTQLQISDWATLTRINQPHGLLGQTWKMKLQLDNDTLRISKPKGDRHMMIEDVIEGTMDDYSETDNDIMGLEFTYNKFTLDW